MITIEFYQFLSPQASLAKYENDGELEFEQPSWSYTLLAKIIRLSHTWPRQVDVMSVWTCGCSPQRLKHRARGPIQ
jgi:hypothetical protein